MTTTDSFDTSKINTTEIAKWSNEEVVNWIKKEYSDKPKRKNLLVEAMEENEYSGKELMLCGDIDELMDALDIKKKLIAKSLFEKIQSVKESAVNATVKAAESNIGDIKQNLSAKDLDYLIKVFEDLFPVKRDDEIKQDEEKEDSPIQQFVEMVKGIANETRNFIKSVFKINVKQDVTSKIINICFDYYKLLATTLSQFRGYGSDMKQLRECIAAIRDIFMLPLTIKQDLECMDTTSKQKAIIQIREMTTTNLKNRTKQFDDLLNKIEKEHITNLKNSAEQWLSLNQQIVKLLSILKDV
eukprot:192284_1